MHQLRPATVLRGRARTPHVALFLLAVFGALWALGSLVGLAQQFSAGWTGSFEYRGRRLPLWALFAVSVVGASYATWDSVAGWRMTGPRHGVIDYLLEPAGIRLVRPRTWGRARELLVQRTEAVEIDAELVLQRRAGAERHYRFTVSAPGGSFAFTQAIHIERLSLIPLDTVARELGVEVRTSGAASVVGRLGGATQQW